MCVSLSLPLQPKILSLAFCGNFWKKQEGKHPVLVYLLSPLLASQFPSIFSIASPARLKGYLNSQINLEDRSLQ